MGAIRLDDLDTPCLTVDLDVFERNVRTCLSNLARVHVRPHLKTAKSPDVARLLIDAGAVGVCVAKLSEAEVMLGSGIDDVLITTEIAGEVKVRRLARLIAEEPAARVRIVVDSWDGATAIDAALPRPLETLIDVNVGQDRCGIAPEDALGLADRIRGLERLRLIGVQGYEGHLQHVRDATERRSLCDTAMGRLGAVADELSSAGHAITVVTTGGTGTAQFCAAHSFVTEVQPGSFAFMDTDYLDTGGLPYESSLQVVATVISRAARRPGRDRRRAEDAVGRFRTGPAPRRPGLELPPRRRRARKAHVDRRVRRARAAGRRSRAADSLAHRPDDQSSRRDVRASGRAR